MGILKSAVDTVYTFRFLKLLVTPFNKTKAFESGIIDENGKKLKKPPFDTIKERQEYKDYYTPFIRLVFNIKRLMEKAPGGSSRLASYAAALFLIKEDFGVSEKSISKGLNDLGINSDTFISEATTWYVDQDTSRLSQGVYKVIHEKMLNSTYDEMVKKNDKIRVLENSYPVGNMFGLDVYEGVHIKTFQNIYFTLAEISK